MLVGAIQHRTRTKRRKAYKVLEWRAGAYYGVDSGIPYTIGEWRRIRGKRRRYERYGGGELYGFYVLRSLRAAIHYLRKQVLATRSPFPMRVQTLAIVVCEVGDTLVMGRDDTGFPTDVVRSLKIEREIFRFNPVNQ